MRFSKYARKATMNDTLLKDPTLQLSKTQFGNYSRDAFFVYCAKSLIADFKRYPTIFFRYKKVLLVKIRQQPNLFFAIGMRYPVPD